MARPTTHLDLPEWDRKGNWLVQWDNDLLSQPEIAEHIIKAQKAAKAKGLAVDRDGIYRRPTAEELEAKLIRAQEAWDKAKAAYEVAVEFGAEDTDLYWINSHARNEGLPLIEKRPQVGESQ